ncbi:RNA 2'-phosphotransferase [Roseofilum capinflatum]|uniref:Probable RNA 2'-phosphotransferase n=1 Tax=Roseofilum capinflatum BLCC-M114 TaxID=3022440 RepID=A0ABT7BBY0_9CYAN|nr:RNA 2'-phosphotransferase [Roseofilum capinflatum]MDJ1176699.1 RNA 2'-phosphotransferase [Roseofilum capinflatum BLCC-M114]
MTPKRLTQISKYLSKHLRHQPERIGLTLEMGGWVEVHQLLHACRNHQFPISFLELEEVVKTNDKKRFSFNETQTKIRANQGHSYPIDLQLEPIEPPPVLYHGTHQKAISSILKQGLLKQSRHHVHLSSEIATAVQVGQRRGKPVVLEIAAQTLHHQGYIFYRSDNGVWLVEAVPPEYLKIIPNPKKDKPKEIAVYSKPK